MGQDATPRGPRIPVEALDDYDIHPAADFFPLIADDELRALADDIKTNGQQEPIWTYQGQLLDGRNRVVACALAGVRPLTQEWRPKAGETPSTFVMSRNVHRRHLTASQKAMLATRLAEVIGAERAEQRKSATSALANPFSAAKPTPQSPKRQTPPAAPPELSSAVAGTASEDTGGKVRQGRVREQAASTMGVSTGYVNDAKNLRETDPEMAERVARGELSIPEAQKQIVERHLNTGGTIEDIQGLRPAVVRDVMRKIDEENRGKRPEPKARITLPKASKVTSSATSLQFTVTFGNSRVAEEWLNNLQDDKRVLFLDYSLMEKDPRKSRKRS